MIYEVIKSQSGEFCSHMISKESGVDIMYVQSILHQLCKKRKIRFVWKKPCQTFASIHRFYERKGKRMWGARKRYTRQPIEKRIAKTRKLSEYIKAARKIRTAKEQAQIPTSYIPQGKIPPENIKQRVETCSCGCNKKRIVIEIYLE